MCLGDDHQLFNSTEILKPHKKSVIGMLVDYSDSEDEDEIIEIESEDKEAEDSKDEVIETESNKKEDVESEDKEAEDSEDEVIEPESNKEEDVENLEEIEAQVKDKEIDIESPPLCCIPCTLQISDECKVCLFCKDKPKYGGLNKLKQKCIKRTCLKKRKRVENIMSTKSSSTSTSTRQSKRRKGM